METKTLSNTVEKTITGAPVKIQITDGATDGKERWYTPLTTPDCIVTPENTTFDWVTNLKWENPIPDSTNTYSTLIFTSWKNGKTETVTLQGSMPDITIGDNGNWFINGNDSGKASTVINYEEIK